MFPQLRPVLFDGSKLGSKVHVGVKQDHSECPQLGPETYTELLDGLQHRLWFTVGANTLIAEAPGNRF